MAICPQSNTKQCPHDSHPMPQNVLLPNILISLPPYFYLFILNNILQFILVLNFVPYFKPLFLFFLLLNTFF
uniref:Uncharacterized protein n=1 Tax=Octopus bimaculoides TaxID=37653 RepID=A0A0L8GQ20_OCTBM